MIFFAYLHSFYKLEWEEAIFCLLDVVSKLMDNLGMKLNGSGYMAHFAGFILMEYLKLVSPGRGNRGGSWSPEEKKANIWHGRGNCGGSWPPVFLCSSYKRFPISQFYWFPLSCLTPVLAFRTLDLSLSGLYVRLSAFCINTISW